MNSRRTSAWTGRLTLAIATSFLFVAWSPFIGEIRNLLRAAFPGTFVRVILGGIGAIAALAILVAVARIRTERTLRYSALALAVGCFFWYVRMFSTGFPEVDAVERFHFIEYGLVAFLYYRAFLPAGDLSVLMLALLSGSLVGIAEEWVQWFVPTRVGEIRDVYLNVVALGCGVLFSVGVYSLPPQFPRLARVSLSRICRLAAVVVFAFGIFFHSAHLGYEIDDEVGMFRSFFTREQLLTLQRSRVDDWQLNPPGPPTGLSREDQYRTEAIRRVHYRNTAYEEADFSRAWHENRILEKYYAPFLDLAVPKLHGPTRWAPEQRAEVESKAGGAGLPYVSLAGHDLIVIAPTKRTFWLVVGTIVGILLAVSEWLRRERRGRRQRLYTEPQRNGEYSQ